MEYVYMGIFSSVFNWVLNKIFTPVFEWLAKLLNTVLSWLFNNVLGPLLQKVLWPLIEQLIKMIMTILAGVLYGILAQLLTFLDNINKMFDYMIGLEKITYQASSGAQESMTLLDAFVFKMPGVNTAFWMINCAGLTLALMLAIISVSKSSLDLDFENRRPISKVMSSLFKCVINLFTVQLFVYFMIKLSALILSGINLAMNQIAENGGSTTLGRIIFCVVSMNAATDTAYNLDTATNIEVGINDAVRSDFYLGTKSYADSKVVAKSFDLAKFDYLMGYALALFLIVVMIACVVVFIRRIYDVLILYLTSPYFIAMMPIDDGQRFGAWRELFIGKLFSGFGMVMAMKLYIMLCPAIMGGSLIFSDKSPELNYMAKMLFLLGGAWATLKSGTIVTSLLSAGAGADESQTANMTSGAIFAAGGTVAGAATGAIFSGVGSAIGKKFSKSRQERSESQQKFESTKFKGDGASAGSSTSIGGGTSAGSSTSIGGGSSVGGSSTPVIGNAPAIGSTPAIGSGTPAVGSGSSVGESSTQAVGNAPAIGSSTPPESNTAAPTNDTSTGSNTAAPTGEASRATGNTSGASQAPGNTASIGTGNVSGSVKRPLFEKAERGKVVGSYPLGIKKYQMKDGSTRMGFNLGGKLLGMKRDDKGTKVQFLGMSMRFGKDGKVNKFNILGVGSGKRGTDGNFHTAKLNIAGFKFRANSDDGKLKMTDIQMIGLHREQQENGEYRVTSALGGLYQQSFAKNEDGSLETAGVRFMGMNLKINEEAAEHNRRLSGQDSGQNNGQ
jgi:hypothetical protein